jgi:hypothetical protein
MFPFAFRPSRAFETRRFVSNAGGRIARVEIKWTRNDLRGIQIGQIAVARDEARSARLRRQDEQRGGEVERWRGRQRRTETAEKNREEQEEDDRTTRENRDFTPQVDRLESRVET